MLIEKRDGRKVVFDKEKIEDALYNAYVAEVLDRKDDGDFKAFAQSVSDSIEKETSHSDKSYNVEDIQDLVEKHLMDSKYKSVARAYITYRNQRTLEREKNSKLMKELGKKLLATNIENQNANVDEHSFGGRMGEARSIITKEYALNNCMSKKSKQNHIKNRIYEHDLDSFAVGEHNCLNLPLDKLLKNGFNTRQTDVRPAKSINTAMQLVAVLFQLQSLQQYGGVGSSHLDWTMVPYVRMSLFKHYMLEHLKDVEDFEAIEILDSDEDSIDDWVSKHTTEYLKSGGLTKDDFFIGSDKLDKRLYKRALFETRKETYQAVEGLYHNLNTLQSRSGNQLPFTSINYGTCTLPEGRLIIRALLEVSIKGIGKLHKTPIFPCGIFQYWGKVNGKPGTPNYDLFRLALKSTAKRLYPNYANIEWSGNKGFDENDPNTYMSTMGCRTMLGYDVNGMGLKKDGRGNIAPVTIILPTLAMEARLAVEKASNGEYSQDALIKKFMKILDKAIDESREMLLERYDWICSQPVESAKFMYENGTMEGFIPEEGIKSALCHGTLAIGQLGLAETLQILIGKDHTSPEGMEIAKNIEQLFKDRCSEYKDKYSLNFSVYYTPAESLCKTAMTKFKEQYGEIPNVSDKKFFTNSMHVPVWVKIDPFQKIDIESQLTGYSSGGCITYVELKDNILKNIDAMEELVTYAMNKDIPYFACNIPSDTCMSCGYTGDIEKSCPVCGSDNIQRLRRVTGYLTGDYKTAFNEGKQQEVEMRFKHSELLKNNW